MHILLTTYGLLLIFALFSFAQWKSAESFLFTDQLASSRFSRLQRELSGAIRDKARQLYRTERKKRSTKEDPPSSDADAEDPNVDPDHFDQSDEERTQNAKRSSFLNIGPLLVEDLSVLEGKGKSCFTLFISLLQVLYEGELFYDTIKDTYPDLEERFVLACIKAAKKRKEEGGGGISLAKQLLSLDLTEDSLLDSARYGMMRGEKTRKEDAPPQGVVEHYLLQEFVSINKNPQLMSLWLAPRPLLLAAFGDESVVESIIATRQEMHRELWNACRGNDDETQKRSLFDLKKKEMDRLFKGSLISGIRGDDIDFGVSLTKPRDY